MSPENFCYWLQGFNEITDGQAPSQEQWEVIRKHLLLVFTQVIDSNRILHPDYPTQIMPQQFPLNPDWNKPIC